MSERLGLWVVRNRADVVYASNDRVHAERDLAALGPGHWLAWEYWTKEAS